MATFVRLVKMTDQGLRNAAEVGDMIAEARKTLESCGARITSSYLTLGTYDLVATVEAPDNATVAKASALIAAKGNFRAETLPAVSVEEFTKSLKR